MTEHEEGAPAATEARPSAARRARLAFRHWRRTRPFWGGFLVLAGGAEMLSLFYVPWKVILHMGLYGVSGYVVPIVLCVLGLSLLFDPQHRTFYSILALLFSIASWMTSNLGGFMVGMLVAMTGASLAYGWSDAPAGAKEEDEETGPESGTEQVPTS
ncbi:DUF6114 domain-containing protein [Catenulispora subtropica]|uniref:Integral membrane protein n=1 Tax=Catenulispora subtropica TaxID=450798 RepID=A0ABN2SY99_9ACTN